jgi:hypothetical protein
MNALSPTEVFRKHAAIAELFSHVLQTWRMTATRGTGDEGADNEIAAQWEEWITLRLGELAESTMPVPLVYEGLLARAGRGENAKESSARLRADMADRFYAESEPVALADITYNG